MKKAEGRMKKLIPALRRGFFILHFSFFLE